MFPITAYTNKSASNVVHKDITQIVTMQGTLRDNSSITDPVLVIHCDGADVWRQGFNYLYIPSFARYYYVTNMIAVAGVFESQTQLNPTQLWEVQCHVDVLMSFANQIAEQSAVVARQEAKYNLMLDDGFFMSYQDPKIQTKTFSNATPFETQEFVLVVAGS